MKKKATTERSGPTERKPSTRRAVQSAKLITPNPGGTQLFDRVAAILDQARTNVVRAVNSNMVLAYWLIGREIVQEIQGGKERAAYGKRVLEGLSERLNERYGSGFSVANLQNFRQFYLVYETRLDGIHYPMGSEFVSAGKSRPVGAESALDEKGSQSGGESLLGFSPQLNWSHYRALMRVENAVARNFYEQEAIVSGWDKRTLERQIHSFYFERQLKSQHPQKMLAEGRTTLRSLDPAIATLKHPYVLEFLGLPEVAALNEDDVEAAILSYLQSFLLELGKGFAFVARQKRLRIGDEHRYVDLVFYHIQSRFYLLIDLKIGKLTHQDVGQMDGYVRIFDDLCLSEGDNPTIGLILCTEKNEAVAKYSVLKDRKQIFASKYMLYLPTEEELRRELERERGLIEELAALKEEVVG
jgi:predicted nuclease of restriction endonuclease-like (RecB) superfamily